MASVYRYFFVSICIVWGFPAVEAGPDLEEYCHGACWGRLGPARCVPQET